MTAPDARRPRIRASVAVIKGEHVLLVAHQRDGRKGYMLPGGDVEWWEPVEEAVHRACGALGVQVTLNEIVVVAETRNSMHDSHRIHLIYDIAAWGGTPEVTPETAAAGEIVDVLWYPILRLPEADLYPPVTGQLFAALQRRTHGIQLTRDLWHDLF